MDTQQIEVNESSKQKESTLKIVILLVCVFILGCLAGYILKTVLQKDVENKKLSIVKDNASITQPLQPSPTPISYHYLNQETKIYVSTRLKLQFEYPRGIASIYECPDIACLAINPYQIGVTPITFTTAEELLATDLYCSADGPSGSTTCDNQEIQPYTTTHGLKGYKVVRMQVKNWYDPERREESPDHAYVLLVDEFQSGNLKHNAVLFSTDEPTVENLGQLDAIVESVQVVN